jgi:hypothetical protein
MANTRCVRVLVVADVHVSSTKWSSRKVEDAMATLITALGVSSGQAFSNFQVGRFRVLTIGNAYDLLLGIGDADESDSVEVGRL